MLLFKHTIIFDNTEYMIGKKEEERNSLLNLIYIKFISTCNNYYETKVIKRDKKMDYFEYSPHLLPLKIYLFLLFRLKRKKKRKTKKKQRVKGREKIKISIYKKAEHSNHLTSWGEIEQNWSW